MAFAPAEDPKVMALVLIDEPQGVYYGGTVAGPVMQELLQNTLPYLGITPAYSEQDAETRVELITTVPELTGMTLQEAKHALFQAGLSAEVKAEGEVVERQMPPSGETVNKGTKILLHLR